MIGTVSTRTKAALARQNGSDHVILTDEEDFVARVREITEGRGAGSLRRRREGHARQIAGLHEDARHAGEFRQRGGPRPPLDLTLLNKGSYYLTRPSLIQYLETREDMESCAGDFFDVLKRGAVKVTVGQRFPLRNAAKAH